MGDNVVPTVDVESISAAPLPPPILSPKGAPAPAAAPAPALPPPPAVSPRNVVSPRVLPPPPSPLFPHGRSSTVSGAPPKGVPPPMQRSCTESSFLKPAVPPVGAAPRSNHDAVSAGDIISPRDEQKEAREVAMVTGSDGAEPVPGDIEVPAASAEEVEWTSFRKALEEAREEERGRGEAALLDLFEMRYDEVRVEAHERTFETTKCTVPKEVLSDGGLAPFTQECIRTYTAPWNVLVNSAFDAGIEKKGPSSTRRLTVNAGSIADERQPMSLRGKPQSSSSGAVVRKELGQGGSSSSIYGSGGMIGHEVHEGTSQLVRQYFEEPSIENIRKQLKAEISPARIFRGSATSLSNAVTSAPSPNPFAGSSTRTVLFYAEFNEWAFDLPAVPEPLFCAVALYNMRSQQRVSETFHFDLNSPEENAQCKVGHLEETKSCIFEVPKPSAEFHLILRIFKVLRGEPEKDAAVYLKAKTAKKRDLERFAKETNDILQREGCVFQPFLWTTAQLFDENGSARNTDEFTDFRLFKFQCGDEGVFEQIAKEESKKKYGVPGALKLELRRIAPEEPIMGRCNPSGYALYPTGSDQVTKCIQRFGASQSPHVDFVNNLYVYPLTIKSHSANVQVKVALKDNDMDPDEAGLPNAFCVWGPTSFSPGACTSVSFREKRPQFCDELKFKLPANLPPKLHLLFFIYAINIGSKKDTTSLIGRAAVPLVEDGRLVIPTGVQSVPIAQGFLPGYLDPTVQTHFKWVDSHKPIFNFSMSLLSSVHSTDPVLRRFESAIPRYIEGKWEYQSECVAEDVEALATLPPQTCVSFFPSLCSALFKIMCTTESEAVGTNSLTALHGLINCVSAFSGSQSVLSVFLRFFMDEVDNAPRRIYSVLCRLLRLALEKDDRRFMDHRLNWFPVMAIIKSVTICHSNGGRLAQSDTFPDLNLAPGFVEDLECVLQLLYSESETQNLDTMTMFPLLMKDMLSLVDQGIVFKMVYKYISALNPANDNLFQVTVKFTFLNIILNHRHYVALNVPEPMQYDNADTNSLVQTFWRRHFFAGILLREIRMCLRQKKRIREQSITSLRNLFQAHDSDRRYRDPARKSRVTSLYFPFILIAVEGAEFIKGDISAESQMDWLVCLLFVLKNCDRDLVRVWWRGESEERQIVLLNLLAVAISTFKDLREMFLTVCNAVLEVLFDLVADLPDDISLPCAAEVFSVVVGLLANNNRVFLSSMYPFLHVLVTRYGDPLFVRCDPQTCEMLCYNILLDCNCSDSVVRSHAGSAYYVLMEQNLKCTGDVSRMKMQSSVAVSRMVGEEKLKESHHLMDCLKQVVGAAKERHGAGGALSPEDADKVVQQVTSLLTYNQQLANNRNDPHLMADLYLKFAQSYANSPAMRIMWLENLSTLHSSKKNWEEAAQTKIMIGALVAQHLAHKGKMFTDIKAFQLISPNVLEEVPMPKMELPDEENSVWCLDGLIKYLHEAVLLMKQAKQYEICIEIYSLLVQAYKVAKNYSKLIDCLTEFRLLTEVLVETNKDIRILGQYFRVCFYGDALEQQNGQSFIYKCGPRDNLMTFQQMLKETLRHKVENEDDIVVLPNKPVDVEKLEPNKVYAQIASVTPYFDASETDRESPFQRNFNTDKFIFESAIKARGDDAGDSKKKTIFHTELAFPYAKNRLEVVKTREILLSPIEHAIELIDERILKFNTELNAASPRLNSLQQLLQGSVVPMVNEGPLKICDTFLSVENSTKYPRHNVQLLRENMARFSKLAGFAIALNKSVITEEHLAFQNMVEQQYKVLKAKIKEYTDIDDSTLDWSKP